MTIAGLWRYGNWRHVATGCNALVTVNNNAITDTMTFAPPPRVLLSGESL